MLYADLNDKLVFAIMLCSSAFIVIHTYSMHKKASLFKLMGLSFFIPFGLCFTNFVFKNNVQINMVTAFSELCLSLCILLLLFRPFDSKSYNIKTAIIILFTLILAVYMVKSEQFIYYTFPGAVGNGLKAILTAASIFYVIRGSYDKQFIQPLAVWFASILLGFAESHEYIKEILPLLKAAAFAFFAFYFHKMTYKAYMEKLREAENLKEAMENSLNKEVRKRVFEIEKSNERLLEISKTDLLTKTLNKITILNVIEKLINSKREDVFSILMFDIDNFKTINDSLGHVTGDVCLKTLANIASGNIREVDYLGRYGGDEFIIVLPSLAQNEAKFVAERFKNKVNETSNPKFTVSIGIATYPYDGETVKDLISAADKGLYKSKHRGKNTISHASLF